MEAQLPSPLSREITENLDEIVKDILKGFGFEQFDAETSPEVYLGVSMLYFFALGVDIHKMDLPTNPLPLYDGLIKHLQTAKLIEQKPRNYQELKDTLQNLFSETSRYLTDKV